MFKLLISIIVGMAVGFSPASRMGARSLKMTATAADVISETTLATMARDARGLAIDSISAVSIIYSATPRCNNIARWPIKAS